MRHFLPVAAAWAFLAGPAEAREQDSGRPQASKCSMDALPAAERRRGEAEYERIFRAQGKPAADRWARQEGARFRQKLVSQGICPPLDGASSTKAASDNASGRKTGRGGGKGKCTKTVMQARNIANPGGGAMTMIMVPVCVN